MSQLSPRPGIGHNISPLLHQRKHDEAADYDDGLLATAGPIMVLCYAGALAIAWITFFASGDALYVVTISIAFALLYFTLPLLMRRERDAYDVRWQRDTTHRTSATVDLWTGPIPRWEGVAQIVSVPLTVLLGFAAFAVIWTLTA
jgi:hypothetical protein